MSVHKEISKHSQEQHDRVQTFMEYDRQREHWIEVAIAQCKEEQPYDAALRNINTFTDRINDLARKGIVPQRKHVTSEMIDDYCKRT